MNQHTMYIKLKSNKNVELIDITQQVTDYLTKSKIKNGVVIVYSKHTTTSIRINENETRLIRDIEELLEKIAPATQHYLHDDIGKRPECQPDERINGHSHMKSLLLNTSETIPMIDGKLALGKWQSIFFIELDGPREREILIKIMGD